MLISVSFLFSFFTFPFLRPLVPCFLLSSFVFSGNVNYRQLEAWSKLAFYYSKRALPHKLSSPSSLPPDQPVFSYFFFSATFISIVDKVYLLFPPLACLNSSYSSVVCLMDNMCSVQDSGKKSGCALGNLEVPKVVKTRMCWLQRVLGAESLE